MSQIHHGKKAQITFTIIVVIVLLVAFGVVYYMRGSEAEQQTAQAISTQRLSAEKAAPVDDYIKSTLDLVAMEGLELLGMQGGHIYQSQDGISPDLPDSANGQDFLDFGEAEAKSRVRYLIYGAKGILPGVYYSSAPGYPWTTFPKMPDGSVRYTGFFGFNYMPFLTRQNNTNSIQEQLESFTMARLSRILDFSLFELQNLNITPSGEPNLTVDFDISTVFTLHYPLLVKDITTGAETTISDFQVAYPINFVTIQKFAYDIIEKDITDIKFDIRTAKQPDYPGIGVQVLEDAFQNDDLITIEDRASRIIDQPYRFRFMRHNRMPALEYIELEEGYRASNGTEISIADGKTLVINNNQAGNDKNIAINAYDPDEDEALITFKEDLPFWTYRLYTGYLVTEADASSGALNISAAAFEKGGQDQKVHDWQVLEIQAVLVS